MFFIWPVERSSMMQTSCPLRRSSSERCDPIKPEPFVNKYFIRRSPFFLLLALYSSFVVSAAIRQSDSGTDRCEDLRPSATDKPHILAAPSGSANRGSMPEYPYCKGTVRNYCKQNRRHCLQRPPATRPGY